MPFVILLWLEPQPGAAAPVRRWRVKQGQTGEEACFHRLGDLLAYVSSRTGLPAPR